MSWEDIIKEGFEDIDAFITQMKQLNMASMNSFKEFNTKTEGAFDSVEMSQLTNAIIDMGKAIGDLEKMRDRQESLQ